MIGKDEIDSKAIEFNVHTSNVQRDYIHGWLLSGIYKSSDLSNHLCLRGGNAFRKCYFVEARYSPDLDFVTKQRLSNEYLRDQLKQVITYVSDLTNVKFDEERTLVDEKETIDKDSTLFKVRLYFNDFYGKENSLYLKIRLDVSDYGKIFLPVQQRDMLHLFSDSNEASTKIRCLQLEELLASKLKCLLQRRHSADLYDFVNATIFKPTFDINRSKMVDTFLKMTIFESGPRIVEDLLINLPFQIIKELWDRFVIAPINASIDFDKAKDEFINLISAIFGNLPEGTSSYAFFPSEFRNPIMQAATDLTILDISYQGYQRMVEPYSLKYKRRKDGISREYFYVYDRTGGSSGPGIKCLVADDFQYINNTDIVFEPRDEVELSKAGEMPDDNYFKGSPRRGSSFGYTSQKHVVECPICGRRFYRKTRNTTLKPHKDKQGYQCYGRHGYHVY